MRLASAMRAAAGLRAGRLVVGCCLLLALLAAAFESPAVATAEQEAVERVERRLFDGAPPVIPHEDFGDCTDCHYQEGTEVPDVGFAPASPHANLDVRCVQCHVLRTTDDVFTANTFAALRREMEREERPSTSAPPVIPHDVFMRGNCVGCHSGEAAREWIRTSHPERVRCRQCHVEQRVAGEFGG